MSHAQSTAPSLRVVQYSSASFEEIPLPTTQPAGGGVLWIDIDVSTAPEKMEELRALFDLHPLTVADALGPPQRAKYETYPTCDFLLGRILPKEHGRSLSPQQLCLFVGDTWVISARRGCGDLFATVRDRLHAGGPVRLQGSGFLAYALLSTIVDGY